MLEVGGGLAGPQRGALQVERRLGDLAVRDRRVPLDQQLDLELGELRDLLGDLLEALLDVLPEARPVTAVLRASDLDSAPRPTSLARFRSPRLLPCYAPPAPAFPTGSASAHGTGEGDAPTTSLRARLAQRPGAGVERRAGRVDVVDEHHRGRARPAPGRDPRPSRARSQARRAARGRPAARAAPRARAGPRPAGRPRGRARARSRAAWLKPCRRRRARMGRHGHERARAAAPAARARRSRAAMSAGDRERAARLERRHDVARDALVGERRPGAVERERAARGTRGSAATRTADRRPAAAAAWVARAATRRGAQRGQTARPRAPARGRRRRAAEPPARRGSCERTGIAQAIACSRRRSHADCEEFARDVTRSRPVDYAGRRAGASHAIALLARRLRLARCATCATPATRRRRDAWRARCVRGRARVRSSRSLADRPLGEERLFTIAHGPAPAAGRPRADPAAARARARSLAAPPPSRPAATSRTPSTATSTPCARHVLGALRLGADACAAAHAPRALSSCFSTGLALGCSCTDASSRRRLRHRPSSRCLAAAERLIGLRGRATWRSASSLDDRSTQARLLDARVGARSSSTHLRSRRTAFGGTCSSSRSSSRAASRSCRR